MKAWIGLLLAGTCSLMAAEEKKTQTPEPPLVLVRSPLGLRRGFTNEVTLRGQNLLSVTNAVSKTEGLLVNLRKVTEAKPPDGQDSKRVGNQAVELSLYVPETGEGNTMRVELASTNGLVCVTEWLAFPAVELTEEKESNNGFKTAQAITRNMTIRGSINPKKDVDVYELVLAGGVSVRVEIQAEGLQSALDGLLTVFDESGRFIASNDDEVGRDPVLIFKTEVSGRYYAVVQDANDRGGDAHPYLLRVKIP